MREELEARIRRHASRHASGEALHKSGRLKDEIERLRTQASALEKQLNLQIFTLVSEKSASAWLERHLTRTSGDSRRVLDFREGRRARQAHVQECLYRTCAGITMCRIRDPDPSAAKSDSGEGGDIKLGLRIEVVSHAKFLCPYYVILEWHDALDGSKSHSQTARQSGNADNNTRSYLRVHRHTVPPCISLSGLAAKYLPPPRPNSHEEPDLATQDLTRFARALRHELLCYHNRLGVVADLRNAAGLGKKRKRADNREQEGRQEHGVAKKNAAEAETEAGAGAETETDSDETLADETSSLLDIGAADAAVRQVSMQWADGRTGRLVMDDDGQVHQSVVFSEGGGRDWKTAREFLGNATRADELLAARSATGPASGGRRRDRQTGAEISENTARVKDELARWLAPGKAITAQEQ